MSTSRNSPKERHGFGLRQRLLASDPGLVRLRLGSRALITVVLVCTALAMLHPWLALTPAAYGIALATAIQGAVAIKDTTARARAITRAIAVLTGFCVICLVSAFGHERLGAVNVIFLCVIFVAVYARRFGTRWQGVGMFAFMCCMIAAYLHPVLTDLPGIALSLVLSAVIAHLTRNVLIPERPAEDFRRAAEALDECVGRLAGQIRRGVRWGWTPATRAEALSAERRGKDVILLCEAYLPMAESGTDPHAALLAARLFDLHLAMESALGMALAGAREAAADGVSGRMAPAVAERLETLARARHQVRAAAQATPDAAFQTGGGPEPRRPPSTRTGWRSDPALREAFQVTLASAIAMTGGIFLSPDRWFWAVLTAFLIFTNTQSRGETMIRGLERALGTAGGIIAGMVLATAIHGALAPTLVLVAACVFWGFYLLTVSYGAMTFFMTVAISLVYGLIGTFTPELLILRLEETLIGAAAGMFVSLCVLPRSTRSLARQAMDRFMQALDQFVESAIALDGGDNPARLLVRVRQLDRAHADIRAAIGPLQSAWTFGAGQAEWRRAIMRVNAIVHAVHVLARRFGTTPPTPPERERLEAIRAQIAALAEHGRSMTGRSRLAEISEALGPESEAASSESVEIALRALLHVLQQVDRSNQARGAA